MRYLIGLLLLVLAGWYFVSGELSTTHATPSSITLAMAKSKPTATPTIIPQLHPDQVFTLINKYRIGHDLAALTWDESMCPFAYQRLEQTHTDWSHDKFFTESRSDKSYVGYIGENLGRGYFSDNDLVNAWLKSPEHLKNIVDPHFTRTCIVTDHVDQETYAVQEFASY